MLLSKRLASPIRPLLSFIRSASTRTNPFPFPRNSNPTPHQIFHLTPQASQKDIKDRYYDLVRLYHPDSPVCRSFNPDPTVRQARFHAIATAYESLQAGNNPHAAQQQNQEYAQWEALRRAYRMKRDFDDVVVDSAWKERLLPGLVLLTLIAGMAQSIATRRQAVAEMKERQRIIDTGKDSSDISHHSDR